MNNDNKQITITPKCGHLCHMHIWQGVKLLTYSNIKAVINKMLENIIANTEGFLVIKLSVTIILK